MASQIKVDEFTTPDPIFVERSTTLPKMKVVMKSQGIRHLLVSDESNNLLGIVSERDIIGVTSAKIFNELTAGDIMSTNLLTVSPETPLYDVALEMSENKFGSAIVCDANNKPVGIFTDTDALNALVEVLRGDLDQRAQVSP